MDTPGRRTRSRGRPGTAEPRAPATALPPAPGDGSGAVPGTSGAPGRRPRWRRWVLAGGALAVVVAVTAVVTTLLSGDGGTPGAADTTLDPAVQQRIDEAVAEAMEGDSLSTAEVYQVILPSLVYVEVGRGATTAESGGAGGTGGAGGAGTGDGTADDGAPGGDEAGGDGGTGIGTGVVANADGTILTALHVVDGADHIEVVFADGTRAGAEVSSTDPSLDIATLAPDALPSVLVPAVLAAGGPAVGDDVVAVGHPLGLLASATAGVVSGLDRIVREDTTELDGAIQFDAAVNPGSSGGPLLNTRGEVVGIVVALADPGDDGYFIGIGFAVPVAAAVGGEGGGGGPQI